MKPSVSCRSSEVRVALERRGRDAAVVTSLSQPGKQKSALESSTVSTFLRSEKNRRSFCSFRPETQSTVCQATYRGTCGIGTTRALAQLFSDHQGSLVTKISSWIGHCLKFLRSEIRNSATRRSSSFPGHARTNYCRRCVPALAYCRPAPESWPSMDNVSIATLVNVQFFGDARILTQSSSSVPSTTNNQQPTTSR